MKRCLAAKSPLRPFHVLHFHAHAHLRQLRGHDFAALAGVGRGWQGEGERQGAIGQGFFEQLAGLVRVIGIDAGQVYIAGAAGGTLYLFCAAS